MSTVFGKGDKVAWRETVEPHLVSALESLKQRHGPGPFWVVEEQGVPQGLDLPPPGYNPRMVRVRNAARKETESFISSDYFVRVK